MCFYFFVCIGPVCLPLISRKADDQLANDWEFTVEQTETLDMLFTDHKVQIVFYEHSFVLIFHTVIFQDFPYTHILSVTFF